MNIQFIRLSQINRKEIITLNTHPLVLQHMPLGDTQFDDEYCRDWVMGKEQHWAQYGYGVWAFIIDKQFAGWGGFQNEGGDADLALVLHPKFWGAGRKIVQTLLKDAFTERNLSSITIHLPLTRQKLSAIYRYGFLDDGTVDFDGVIFKRFRLKNNQSLT